MPANTRSGRHPPTPPAPVVDRSAVPAGWADFALKQNWSFCKSDFRETQSMPKKRDPTLRGKKEWTGEDLLEQGRKKKANAEAIVGQVDGDLAEKACDNCENEDGPFHECVILGDRYGGACVNCHFAGHDARCSLYNALAQKRKADTKLDAQSKRSLQQLTEINELVKAQDEAISACTAKQEKIVGMLTLLKREQASFEESAALTKRLAETVENHRKTIDDEIGGFDTLMAALTEGQAKTKSTIETFIREGAAENEGDAQ